MKTSLILVMLAIFLLCGAVAASAQDTDLDGLDDLIEASLGTDPNDPDTDDDGLLDGDEDVDADGVLDGDETDALDADTDDDGLSDGDEIAWGTNPLDPDSDGDGLSDGLEVGMSAPVPAGNRGSAKRSRPGRVLLVGS